MPPPERDESPIGCLPGFAFYFGLLGSIAIARWDGWINHHVIGALVLFIWGTVFFSKGWDFGSRHLVQTFVSLTFGIGYLELVLRAIESDNEFETVKTDQGDTATCLQVVLFFLWLITIVGIFRYVVHSRREKESERRDKEGIRVKKEEERIVEGRRQHEELIAAITRIATSDDEEALRQVGDALRGAAEMGGGGSSCFISYSSSDEEFATHLYQDLQRNGIKCWYAPHDMRGGDRIYDQINQAIQVYDRLLVILSKASMESEWVKTEMYKALRRESRNRRVLFPVRLIDYQTLREWEWLDPETGRSRAQMVREFFIPDFSNWRSRDLYKEAFDRLLRDLQLRK